MDNGAGGKKLYTTEKSRNGAYWLPLLEKAYAKLNQNYDRIIGGDASVALRDLTGLPVYTINPERDGAFEEIHGYNQANYPIVTGCCKKAGTKIAGKVETSGSYGLVSGHAYSLLNSAVVGGEKLVKVRNPWASEMYTGPWSDSDNTKWTAEATKALNHTSVDDGSFWLPFAIYKENFDGLAVAPDGLWNVHKR